MRRARILVVDDQAYVRDFLSEELGQDGYVVKSSDLSDLKVKIRKIISSAN